MDGLTKATLATLSASNTSRDDWLALLDLSFHHHLPESRALAIRNLTSMFAGMVSKKIILAQKYQVKHWLRDGLQELVQRKQPLSDDEGEVLGFKTVLKLYRARDSYNAQSRLYYYSEARDEGAIAEIEKEFGSELGEMNDEPNAGN